MRGAEQCLKEKPPVGQPGRRGERPAMGQNHRNWGSLTRQAESGPNSFMRAGDRATLPSSVPRTGALCQFGEDGGSKILERDSRTPPLQARPGGQSVMGGPVLRGPSEGVPGPAVPSHPLDSCACPPAASAPGTLRRWPGLNVRNVRNFINVSQLHLDFCIFCSGFRWFSLRLYFIQHARMSRALPLLCHIKNIHQPHC